MIGNWGGQNQGPIGSEQIVATGGRIPKQLLNPSASQLQLQTRRAIKFGGQGCIGFRLLYAGYYADDTEHATGNAYSVEAAVTIDAAAIPGAVRARFSGSFNGSVPSGQAVYASDLILPGSFGYSYSIPAGTLAWVNDCIRVTNGQNYPYSSAYTAATGEGAYTSPVQQFQNYGALTLPRGGASVGFQSSLIGIVGVFLVPEVSLLILGDSIMSFNADVYSAGLDGASGGVAVRGALSVGGRTIPWINASIGGTTIVGTNGNITKRLSLAPYATHVVGNWVTNDIATGTPLIGDLTTARKALTAAIAAAGPRVDYVLALPRGTSSDQFLTTANQTPATGFEAAGLCDQFNTDTLADVGSHGLTSTINLGLRDPVATDKWAVDGTTIKYTTDTGVHPFGHGLTVGAAAMAARFATYTGRHP